MIDDDNYHFKHTMCMKTFTRTFRNLYNVRVLQCTSKHMQSDATFVYSNSMM